MSYVQKFLVIFLWKRQKSRTKKQDSLQNLPDFITPHANSAYMEQNLSQILDQRYGTPEEIKQAL